MFGTLHDYCSKVRFVRDLFTFLGTFSNMFILTLSSSEQIFPKSGEKEFLTGSMYGAM